METINQIMVFADSMFARLPRQITPIDSMALAASVIVLSVLSTAPNRLTQIFEAFAFAVLGLLILFAPYYAIVVFAIGCGLVGVVRSRNRLALVQKQLDGLTRVVHELELVENRCLIELLNSPYPPVNRVHQHDAPSIMPSEKSDAAADSPALHVVSPDIGKSALQNRA